MIHTIAQDSSVAAGTSERYSYAGPFVDGIMLRHTYTNATNADPNERIGYLAVTVRFVGPHGTRNSITRTNLRALAYISDWQRGEALLAGHTTGDHVIYLDLGHVAMLPGEECELIVYNESADAEANAILIDAAVIAASNGPSMLRVYTELMDTQFQVGDVEQIWVYEHKQDATDKEVTFASLVDHDARITVKAGSMNDAFALEFAEMATRLFGEAEKLDGKIALVYDSDSQAGIPLTVQYSIVGTNTSGYTFRALVISLDDEPATQTQKRASAELSEVRKMVASVPRTKVGGLKQRGILPAGS